MLEAKGFLSMCLPVMTCGLETDFGQVSRKKLRTSQRGMEKSVLGITVMAKNI